MRALVTREINEGSVLFILPLADTTSTAESRVAVPAEKDVGFGNTVY